MADTLQLMRVGRGLTQRQLARRLGCKTSWVSSRERACCGLSVTQFIQWCVACEVDPERGLALMIDAMGEAGLADEDTLNRPEQERRRALQDLSDRVHDDQVA